MVDYILDDIHKKKIGYSDQADCCAICQFCNYAKGNVNSTVICGRNPDFPLVVNEKGVCDKFLIDKLLNDLPDRLF